jgi:toxin ParE1/3/4
LPEASTDVRAATRRADPHLTHRYDAVRSAGGYIDRLEAACRALEIFPERGTRRDDIRPGLRVMGFERRATIIFQVTEGEVVIVRIFYGGQDYEAALRDGGTK